MKWMYFKIAVPTVLILSALSYFQPYVPWAFVIVGPIVLLGLYDILQRKHTVWRNFPVIGHFRYMLEAIRPEIQQYFIEPDWGGRPITRDQRKVVYARAKGELDTIAFGTQLDVYKEGHEWLKHSIHAVHNENLPPRVEVGVGEKAYRASIFNISAMSYGALSKNAILALNHGAKVGNFYHNTGEGGLSRYHLQYGGDIVWQLGTAYFGCRKESGVFCRDRFKKQAAELSVKMIEIKLSQGAKPGGGGILPGCKVTEEIAKARGIPVGVDVHSPPSHTAFNTPIEMMEFIQELRELSSGKPVGFKLCIGSKHDFFAICKAMLETGLHPDFITVDGAEGGTGAAPMSFANNIGMPLNNALAFVHDALVGVNLRDRIRIISSGKLTSEFEIISKFALGADMVNSARGMMLALGCIQSLRCNTNKCPTGITTSDPQKMYGLVIEEKYKRVANYHAKTIRAVSDILGAAGLKKPHDIQRHHILRRVDPEFIKSYAEIYPELEAGALLSRKIPEKYRAAWELADPNSSAA